MPAADPTVSPPSPSCGEQASAESAEAGTAGLGHLLRRATAELACMASDVDAVMAHDPAARTKLEVVLTYPGLHAIWAHRASHALHGRGQKLAARVLSHAARMATGVEIHPGATLGRGVFIDHGMGVVIGETAVVGDGCILYKGVVLGGTSTERTVRHPQLGARVVVGSNACLLGAIKVGDGARIGSGSVVVRAVPENATVVGVPGRVVPPRSDRRGRFDATLDHSSLPDPVSEMLRSLMAQNERLRERLARVESKLDVATEDEDDDALVDADLATGDLPKAQVGG